MKRMLTVCECVAAKEEIKRSISIKVRETLCACVCVCVVLCCEKRAKPHHWLGQSLWSQRESPVNHKLPSFWVCVCYPPLLKVSRGVNTSFTGQESKGSSLWKSGGKQMKKKKSTRTSKANRKHILRLHSSLLCPHHSIVFKSLWMWLIMFPKCTRVGGCIATR